MTQRVSEWLPRAAVIDTALDTQVTTVVARWSARWFAVGGISAGSAKPLADANGLAASKSNARGVDLRIDDERLDGLARLLLDIPRDLAMDGLARRIAHDVAVTAVHELVADLAAALQLPLQLPANGDNAIVSFPLRKSDGGAALAHLTLRWASLVHGRKARIGSPRSLSCGTVADALAGQQIPFDAILGNVALSVPEFQALDVGDVLLFDADPTNDVVLRLQGSDGRLTRASLHSDADRLVLLAA